MHFPKYFYSTTNKPVTCKHNISVKIILKKIKIRIPKLIRIPKFETVSQEICNATNAVLSSFFSSLNHAEFVKGKKRMSRTTIINLDMLYKIDFTCAIRGHHVYKTTWTPVLNEKLDCKKDTREETLSHDKHSIGVYRKDGTLVGHMPIELSRLMDYFMKNKEENFVSATVAGPRKWSDKLLYGDNKMNVRLIMEHGLY